MMEEGGEPCFDCYDHYNPSPQAQDLEWYYKKAKGGLTAYQGKKKSQVSHTLSDDELSALAHQFRGKDLTGQYVKNYMNGKSFEEEYPDQKYSFAYLPNYDTYGTLTSDEIAQLQQYMNSNNMLEKAWQFMPNMLRHSGSSSLPHSSHLLNPSHEAGGEAFPQANEYPTNWASYSGNQYKGGGEAFPAAVRLQDWFGGDRSFMFQKGGSLYDYAKSLGIDPSYASRKKMFSKYFDEEYTGTAEQNTYYLMH
jgi:hypothetical protein